MSGVPTAARTDRNGLRPKTDFYPTQPAATRALLAVESFAGPVWEPACGDGAIAKEFEAAGIDVISTDLNLHGHGETGIDFLMERHPRAPEIVTNPPYRLANAFVRHALALGARRVAMLLRLAFLEGVSRSDIVDRGGGLARVHVFRERITMAPKGVELKNPGAVAFAWFVWERGHDGLAVLNRISGRSPRGSGVA